MKDGWISSEGPQVRLFEEAFAARVGRRHGVAVSNGSAALEVAVASLDLKPGDEVIVPSFTIISCVAPIVRAGATPVVVDCDPNTWNATPTQVLEKVTDRTRAMILPHIYGLPIDLDPILSEARKRGITVIEDAAEAIGQTYKGRPCGSFGDISVFSFYPNKHLTTGEGGMVVTDNEALAKRCRGYRNLCFDPDGPRFVHRELGWNFRMTALQAAMGLAQLNDLDRSVRTKQALGARYNDLLRGTPGLQLPVDRLPYATNGYWVYGVVLGDEVPFDAKEAMRRLGERGVGTRPFFFPMHEQPVFRDMGLFEDVQAPVSERLARRGFYLPSGIGTTERQIDYAAAELKDMLSRA